MDSLPPAYAPAPQARQRTINDIRSQIIANASLLLPKRATGKTAADDHVEVVVAIVTPEIRTGPAQSSSRSTSNTDAGDEGKHYAVLIRRAGNQGSLKMVMKGEAKDTVEEALEWMLEKTEKMIHGLSGKAAKDEQECVLM